MVLCWTCKRFPLLPIFPCPLGRSTHHYGWASGTCTTRSTWLISRGPYPSVWAMLLLYQHPDNKKTAPKVVSSYQQIYAPTGVDQNSRWTLEWPGLGIISDLKTDLATAGHSDSTCLISCEKADISIHSMSPFLTSLLGRTDVRPTIPT